jgi:hypothetical protein
VVGGRERQEAFEVAAPKAQSREWWWDWVGRKVEKMDLPRSLWEIRLASGKTSRLPPRI